MYSALCKEKGERFGGGKLVELTLPQVLSGSASLLGLWGAGALTSDQSCGVERAIVVWKLRAQPCIGDHHSNFDVPVSFHDLHARDLQVSFRHL